MRNRSRKKHIKNEVYSGRMFDRFSEWENGSVNDPMEHYGHYFQQTMAAVRTGEETLPYRVGTFYYEEGCGLYIIAAYQGKNEKCLMEKLLTALSYTGIGGKNQVDLVNFNTMRNRFQENF